MWLYGSLVYFHLPDALLTPSIDNVDPLIPLVALVITPCFYLHYLEVADQDPASTMSISTRSHNK